MPDLPEQMVTTPEELTRCCNYLASLPHFGFDTEFVGEDTYHPRLCLVQVATDERLLLIDPLSTGPLDAFWELVVDPSRIAVVHAGRAEVRLCRLATGKPPGNLFDLQLAAGLVGMTYPIGHGPLVNQLLGVHLAKGETLTEWRDRPLTPSQIRYAFDDVRYLLSLWQKLSARLEALGRSNWAREEFERMVTTVSPEEPNTEKWRKLRGLGSLDRRRLAVVRALYAWREEAAELTNRPTRAIIRDDLIVEIARRNPAKERDLQVVRGLPHRDLRAILEVVHQARELPPEQCPKPLDRDQDPPQVTLVGNVLSAVLGDLAIRLGVAGNLIASGQDVKQLVRCKRGRTPIPRDCILTQGWRAAQVLPELNAILDGKRLLRVADVRGDAPFAYEDKDGGK
jgi:ribonuclease D